VVCVVWGTTYLAIRIALDTIPPFLMASFRWLSAGALLMALLVVMGKPVPPVRAWPALALMGVLLMGVGNGGVVWAEQVIPSGLTAVLVAAIPFWMVGIERLMGGDRLTSRQVIGLLVGFAGILLLVWPELTVSTGTSVLLGAGATQLACLGWAVGSSLSRRRAADEDVLAAAAGQMLFAGIVLMVIGAAAGEWSALSFSPRTFGALAYLVVVGSIVGYTAYAYALKHLPVATVSLYAYANPVIAVALGSLLLAEPFDSRILIAAAIILAGSAMVKMH
jgi:drug/metabolite transporter (DMT)-like permease